MKKYLTAGKPLSFSSRRLRRQRVQVVAIAQLASVNRHPLPGLAAQQLADRAAKRLAQQVPQGDVDAAERHDAGAALTGPGERGVQALPVRLDVSGVRARQQRREVAVDYLRRAGGKASHGADAGEAGVRFHLHDRQRLGLRSRPPAHVNPVGIRIAQRRRPHFSYAHGSRWSSPTALYEIRSLVGARRISSLLARPVAALRTIHHRAQGGFQSGRLERQRPVTARTVIDEEHAFEQVPAQQRDEWLTSTGSNALTREINAGHARQLDSYACILQFKLRRIDVANRRASRGTRGDLAYWMNAQGLENRLVHTREGRARINYSPTGLRRRKWLTLLGQNIGCGPRYLHRDLKKGAVTPQTFGTGLPIVLEEVAVMDGH